MHITLHKYNILINKSTNNDNRRSTVVALQITVQFLRRLMKVVRHPPPTDDLHLQHVHRGGVHSAAQRRHVFRQRQYVGHQRDVVDGESQRLYSREFLLVGQRRNRQPQQFERVIQVDHPLALAVVRRDALRPRDPPPPLGGATVRLLVEPRRHVLVDADVGRDDVVARGVVEAVETVVAAPARPQHRGQRCGVVPVVPGRGAAGVQSAAVRRLLPRHRRRCVATDSRSDKTNGQRKRTHDTLAYRPGLFTGVNIHPLVRQQAMRKSVANRAQIMAMYFRRRSSRFAENYRLTCFAPNLSLYISGGQVTRSAKRDGTVRCRQ